MDDIRIINHREKPYTMVSNDAINNTDLSCAALGLYAKIQRYADIPNWELRKGHLRSQIKEGEKAFDRMWAELIKKGYLKKVCIREGGKFNYVYELNEIGSPDQAAEEPQKSPRELEMEKELEALRLEVEALRRAQAAAEEPEVNEDSISRFTVTTNSISRFTVSQKTEHGNLPNTYNTLDINNTLVNTPKPPEGARERGSDSKKSNYDFMEQLTDLLPEEVQKDSKHKRRIGKRLLDISPEMRAAYITAASRMYEGSGSDIGSPLAYFTRILDRVIEDPQKAAEPKQKKSPDFCNFDNRKYDYDEIQRKLGI